MVDHPFVLNELECVVASLLCTSMLYHIVLPIARKKSARMQGETFRINLRCCHLKRCSWCEICFPTVLPKLHPPDYIHPPVLESGAKIRSTSLVRSQWLFHPRGTWSFGHPATSSHWSELRPWWKKRSEIDPRHLRGVQTKRTENW